MAGRRAIAGGAAGVAELVVALSGCYDPAPPEGAPCTTSATCPAPLACVEGHCRSSADPVPDAPVPPDPDGPPAAACPEVAIRCDGFETGDLSAWTIRISEPGGSVEIVEGTAHAGLRAVLATVPPQPTSGESAYLASAIVPQGITSFSGVIILEGPDGYALVSGDNYQRWTVSEQSAAGLFDHATMVATEPGRWTCVELDYHFDPPRLQLFVDDALVLDAMPNDPQPVFTIAGVGVTRAPIDGFGVFVDDVVIANQHVGCL